MSIRLSYLLLEDLHNNLKELNDSKKKGPESKTTKVIAESHFDTTSDWRVKLIVDSMIVIPHTAG